VLFKVPLEENEALKSAFLTNLSVKPAFITFKFAAVRLGMSVTLLSGVQDLKDVLRDIKLSNIIWINKTRIIKIKSSYSSFIVEL
jgi:hypothetical protein